MQISLPKLKAILLYFANNTDQRFLGKVKLMKLFYFLDFTHVRWYGVPVTHDEYFHLEHGPIPTVIKNLIDTAADDIDSSAIVDTISVTQQKRVDGSDYYKIRPLRDLTDEDMKLFSDSEIEVLDYVCSKFGGKNTQEIIDASHDEPPYFETERLDQIPYTLAARSLDSKFTEDELTLFLSL